VCKPLRYCDSVTIVTWQKTWRRIWFGVRLRTAAGRYGPELYRGFESLPLHICPQQSTRQHLLDASFCYKSQGSLSNLFDLPAVNSSAQAFVSIDRTGNRKVSETGFGIRRREWSLISFDGRSTNARGSGNPVESKSAQTRANSRRRGM